MSRRHRARRLFLILSLTFIAFSLSGCVYLRLLNFKNQLKSFDKNVAVLSQDRLAFQFHNPVVKDSDFIFISGTSPGRRETIGQSPPEELWTWRFHKRLGESDHQPFTMEFQTRFTENLLTRMVVDDAFVDLVGEDLILAMFRKLGNAKINTLRRSMSTEIGTDALKSMNPPSLDGIFDVMGEPTRIHGRKNDPVARCEYEFNFNDPDTGKKAGQFRLFFAGDLNNPENPITGFRVTGKGQ